jgi:beta-exotoxin I transport system permease protein
MPELFRRALADRHRTLAAWSVGTIAYTAVIAAVFPSVRGSADFAKLGRSYPEVLKHLFGMTGSFNLTTGPGYFDTELFSAMLPLFMLVMAIGTGAGTLAGEQEQGLLELILARPTERRAVVLWKAGALVVEVVTLAAVIAAAILVADAVVGLSLDHAHLAEASAGLALLGTLYGALALAVGAATRHRTSAIGVPASFGAIGYLVAGLSGLASWLSPFRYASPFHYAGQAPLQRGVDASGLLVLAAGTAILVLIAVVIFERRDLSST